jgi:hypothetical protein
MQIFMSEKAKIKSLQKRAREVILAGGPYRGAKAVNMTPLALLSFVHGYAQPQKRTLENLEKYLPKVNLTKLRAESRAVAESAGKKAKPKSAPKKPKAKKSKAKVKPVKSHAKPKPKTKLHPRPKAAKKLRVSKPKSVESHAPSTSSDAAAAE